MNNDTTLLQERIARAVWEYEAGPSGIPWERFAVRCPEVAAERMRNAAPVLPIIAAEVQAAKAEALREAAGPEWGNNNTLWSGPRVRAKITRRATEHETGGQA